MDFVCASDSDARESVGVAVEMGRLLMKRFDSTGNIEDINKAIDTYKQCAMSIPDKHSRRAAILQHLGISYICRFEKNGNPDDIHEAITVLDVALKLASSYSISSKQSYLIALGSGLKLQFELKKNPDDLDRAIKTFQAASKQTATEHFQRPDLLSDLGNLLILQFKSSRKVEHINEAITTLREALRLAQNDNHFKAARMGNLANALTSHFEHFGHLDTIKEAIELQKQVLALTPNDSALRPGRINNLGHSLTWLYRRLGEQDYIDKAISVLKEATEFSSAPRTNLAMYFSNLGSAFAYLFNRKGEVVDIDSSIRAHQRSVELTLDSDSYKPLRYNALGNAYLRRFEWLGLTADINQAIFAQTEANKLAPSEYIHKPKLLNSLGNSYLRRYGRLKNVGDIMQAVSFQESSIELLAHGNDDIDKPMLLNNLGSSLMTYFEKLNQRSKPNTITDLEHLDLKELIDKAVDAQEIAVNLTAKYHPKKPGRLNNLVISLTRRFELNEELADINRAIYKGMEAIRLTPFDHPDRAVFQNSLGGAYIRRFEHTKEKRKASSGAVSMDVRKAINAYRDSATLRTGAPTIQLDSARHWAELAFQHPHLGFSPLEAHECSVNLVPRVVWLGKTVEQRYKDISSIGTSVNDAAAVACDSEDYVKALEWLEQGRSVIWGQILHLRTPVDELRKVAPVLANEIEQVALQLENTSIMSDIEHIHVDKGENTLEETAQAHRRLAERWESLVLQARATPGFEQFLLPQRISTLRAASQSNTVILVNISRIRCDALVLKPGSIKVEHFSLPKETHQVARHSYSLMLASLKLGGVALRGVRGEDKGEAKRNILDNFKNMLLMLWDTIANPLLEHLGYSWKPELAADLPRITWCLTGPLVFLPLHAAGDYETKNPRFKIFNCVISSYTPSLTALLQLQPLNELRDRSTSVLAITQPATPGQSMLPGVTEEVNTLLKQVINKEVVRLDGKNATVAAVQHEMDKHSWIHMACHAIQQCGEPTKSGFLLQDGALYLQAVMKKQIKCGELAFLSACQTASGDESLPEESVHLAAGMLLAGFRSVIATMWSIRDSDAPLVAEAVYSYMQAGNKSGESAAHALHLAVKNLREHPSVGEANFLAWVPFIHIGT